MVFKEFRFRLPDRQKAAAKNDLGKADREAMFGPNEFTPNSRESAKSRPQGSPLLRKSDFLSTLESVIMILPPKQSRWGCILPSCGPVDSNPKEKFPPIRLVTLLLIGMSGTGCLGLAILFANCGIITVPLAIAGKPVVMASERFSESIEHAKGPIPEAVWNQDQLWYRIDDGPATYLPKGYSRGRSLGPSAGSWMVDKRDGKRLFIPKGGVGDVPEGTYRSVAQYATQWQPRDKSMGSFSDELTLKTLIFGAP